MNPATNTPARDRPPQQQEAAPPSDDHQLHWSGLVENLQRKHEGKLFFTPRIFELAVRASACARTLIGVAVRGKSITSCLDKLARKVDELVRQPSVVLAIVPVVKVVQPVVGVSLFFTVCEVHVCCSLFKDPS